ncbi:multicopper oxidase family protein [Larkinella bovis]|uniref:Multicopper oxidase family protein n=1 Tax=Larkinella bovis TaxID=683041 RepID=A0ABW0ICF6_9BACT
MKTKTTVVEYELEAGAFDWPIAPHKTVRAWGFNQQLPGPVLKAKRGDTLVIKFRNELPEPTLIHWHGIRLAAPMDGTGEVQQPVGPGEEFEYRFVVPDAGTFWYHSHANETVQMERGMYGALIVEDEADPVTDADRVMLIDDMKLTADQQFSEPGWFLPRIIERHDGREGDTLLINGKEQPTIEIHAGQVERWRFINASSARYVVLYLGGKEFRIIGTDGGLLEQPRTVTEVLITPGERLDILAGPFQKGETFAIESLPYDRTTFLKAKRRTLATVQVREPKPSVAFIPDSLRTIVPLAPPDAAVTRKIKFAVGPSWKNGMDFLVNEGTHTQDEPVRVGQLQVWEVSNASLMDHPFHLHGFFFQVLEENGQAPAYRAWKDTYNLKPRTTVKIAWMPDNRPGKWMYHCHILEHHAAGMMAHFEVVNDADPAHETAHSLHPGCR